MNIILVHKYFWPDTPPYATILFSIAKKLAADGHNVNIYSSLPGYKSTANQTQSPKTEVIDGVKITRIKILSEYGGSKLKKLFNLIYFPVRVLAHVVRHRQTTDLVMCSTVPPVLIGICCATAARISNAKFIYHCMDIYPEIGKLSGEFKNKLIYRVLLYLDQKTCNIASTVVVLSSDMKQSLINRRSPTGKIRILNNFPIADSENDEPETDIKILLKKPGTFRILFAGNIGRFQNLEKYIQAMKHFRSDDKVELVFLGEGAKLTELINLTAQLKLDNVRFIPHQTVSVARRVMEDADLGIVSLSENVYKYAFPSKTMTYLELGCKILMTVEKNSELAQMLEEHNLGYLADPTSTDSIGTAIRSAMAEAKSSNSMHCKNHVEANYSEEKMLKKWSALVSGMEHNK